MTCTRPTGLLPYSRLKPARVILGLLLFIFPTWLTRPVANAIAPEAHICFSLLTVDKLVMVPRAQASHFNAVQLQPLFLCESARLGQLKTCIGAGSLRLDGNAVNGNRKTISRAHLGTTVGFAQLYLRKLTKPADADSRTDSERVADLQKT